MPHPRFRHCFDASGKIRHVNSEDFVSHGDISSLLILILTIDEYDFTGID
jgi:hypothetical protein